MATPISVPIGKRVRFNEALKSQSLQPNWQVLRIVELSGRRQIFKSVGN